MTPLRSRLDPITIIRTEKPGVVLVQSSRDPGTHYIITNFGTPFAICNCPGSQNHGACKHLNAALVATAEEMKKPMEPEVTKAVAVAEKSAVVVRAEQNRLAVAEHLAGWRQLKELAAEHIKSGYAPKAVTTPEAGALIIQKALELAIPITSAYEFIDIIEGRPRLRGQMIGALVERSGKGTIHIERSTAMECVAVGYRDGRKSVRITCSIDQFQHRVNTNQVWKQYPADMLRWKAIARVGRVMFPDVLGGMDASDVGGGVLDTPEETGGMRIEVIDGEYSVADRHADDGGEPMKGASSGASDQEYASTPAAPVDAEFTEPPATLDPALEAAIRAELAKRNLAITDLAIVLGGLPTHGRIIAKLELTGWTPAQMADAVEAAMKAEAAMR